MADHGKKSPDQVEGKAVADTGPARLVGQYDIDATRIPWPAPGYLQRQTLGPTKYPTPLVARKDATRTPWPAPGYLQRHSLGPTKYPTPLVARKGATNNKQIPDRRQLAKDSGDKQTTNFSKFSQKIEQTRVPEDKQTNATKDKQIRNSKTGGIEGRDCQINNHNHNHHNHQRNKKLCKHDGLINPNQITFSCMIKEDNRYHIILHTDIVPRE